MWFCQKNVKTDYISFLGNTYTKANQIKFSNNPYNVRITFEDLLHCEKHSLLAETSRQGFSNIINRLIITLDFCDELRLHNL